MKKRLLLLLLLSGCSWNYNHADDEKAWLVVSGYHGTTVYLDGVVIGSVPLETEISVEHHELILDFGLSRKGILPDTIRFYPVIWKTSHFEAQFVRDYYTRKK